MVAISDVLHDDETPVAAIAGHPISRVLNGFGGAVLCLAALGLWLVPGSNWDATLMLIKLGMSGFALVAGVALLLSTRRAVHPEVYLDPTLGRLHLIERDEHGQIARRIDVDYDDLSEVDLRDGMMIARDHHGKPVVEMPVEFVENLNEIRAALGPAFARTA